MEEEEEGGLEGWEGSPVEGVEVAWEGVEDRGREWEGLGEEEETWAEEVGPGL